MPILDASLLDTDPDGVALLRSVLGTRPTFRSAKPESRMGRDAAEQPRPAERQEPEAHSVPPRPAVEPASPQRGAVARSRKRTKASRSAALPMTSSGIFVPGG